MRMCQPPGRGLWSPQASLPAAEEPGVRTGWETGPKRRTVTRTGLNDRGLGAHRAEPGSTPAALGAETVVRWDHPGFALWRDVV